MKTLQIETGSLFAAVAERAVSGLLLPYGETGRTNLGKISVKRGAVAIPRDPSVVTFNLDHDRAQPVGRATSLEDTDAGIVATFAVAETDEGDQLLAQVADGTRTRLSAEVSNLVIRDGQIVAGRLFGAAAVPKGAFPSAALAAADYAETVTVDSTTKVEHNDGSSTTTTEHRTTTYETSTPEGDQPTTDQEDTTMGATLDATTNPPAAAPPGVPNPGNAHRPTIASAANLFASIAQAHAAGDMHLLAALDNAVQADVIATQQEQWIGEVYQSRTYTRRYAPLVTPAALTALKATGWKFTASKTPTVADYAGFPNQPTSTEVATEAVEVTASRLAGAGAIDRAFVDFQTPGFWEGYYRECTNDYERKVDAKVPAALAAAGIEVTAETVPTGVSTAASYIVDGALAILDEEIGLPTFAIVGSDLYREFLLTRKEDALEYLSAALGVDEGSLAGFRVVPSSLAAFTSKVLVGTKDSATLFELPGVPIRVNTVNIGTGGVETGVFGYYATLINNAAGLQFVAASWA